MAPVMQFFILDVFAEEPLAGNQLAVFLSMGSLKTEQMQKLAREMNYSEVTFIESLDSKNGYPVRIFTPTREIPFAGHPVLGTAYLIQKEIIRDNVERVVLDLKCGPITVDLSYQNNKVDILWMRHPKLSLGQKLDARQVSSTLGLDISAIDSRFPVQEASTGFPFIFIPLNTLDSLRGISMTRDRYFELIEKTDAKALLAFAPAAYSPQNHMNVRVFAEYYGAVEDPATGSANGALAGYLSHYKYFGSEHVDVRVEQGTEIGRPSLLFLQTHRENMNIDISVGGRVQVFAKGTVEAEVGEMATTSRG